MTGSFCQLAEGYTLGTEIAKATDPSATATLRGPYLPQTAIAASPANNAVAATFNIRSHLGSDVAETSCLWR